MTARFRWRIVDGWDGHIGDEGTSRTTSALADRFAKTVGLEPGARVDIDGVIYEYVGPEDDPR